jgi:flagellar FliJ protein
MKRAERIRNLYSLAQHEERQHSRAFAVAQQKVRDDLKRLEELSKYRREYRQSLPSRSGSSSMHWQEHHKFLQRLDQAVSAQHAVLRDAREHREAQRKRWLVKRQRLDSLGKVLERHERTERQSEDRREQRELDAISPRSGSFSEDA